MPKLVGLELEFKVKNEGDNLLIEIGKSLQALKRIKYLAVILNSKTVTKHGV